MLPTAITTRHFEIFLTMILSRNMAEAADKMGITVAAISKSLKTLERESGLTLFRHSNGRLIPTSEAERLMPFAQRAVEQLDRARQITLELRGGEIGRIVVGTAGPALVSLLPMAIADFHDRWPEIRIEMQIENTHALLEKVAGNEVDIGVGTPLVRDIDPRIMQLCTVQDLCETWLVAMVPRKHKLARASVVQPADLSQETVIGLPADSATTHLIAATFQQSGVSYRTPIVAANAVGVCSLVQQGVGIGLMNPLMLAQDIFPGLVARPFRPRIMLRTCIYYSKLHPPSPPVARLIESLTRAAKTLGAKARI